MARFGLCQIGVACPLEPTVVAKGASSQLAYNVGMPLNNPKRRTDLVVERTGREVLVYSSAERGAAAESGGAIHALNPTAALIWDRCDGAHSLAEIARAVRAQFAVPADRDLVVDVQQTVERLRGQGLLEP